MADPATKKARGPRGNYYTPPTAIKDVLGLTAKKGEYSDDFYSGSAEAIVAAGLLSMDLLPGQPGRNAASVAYRPVGGARMNDEHWHEVPGYLHVSRGGSGRFQVLLTLSREERARRAALREERARDAQQASVEHRQDSMTPERIMAGARRLFDRAVNELGVEEAQRMLDALKPRRARAKHLRLVASRGH